MQSIAPTHHLPLEFYITQKGLSAKYEDHVPFASAKKLGT